MTWRIVCGVVCGLFLQAMFVGSCAAQSNDAILPQGWQDLTPSELVDLVARLESENRFVVDLVRADLAAHAVSLLQTHQSEVAGNSSLLQALLRLAGDSVPPELKSSLQSAVVASAPVTSSSDFQSLSNLVEQLRAIGVPARDRAGHVVDWMTGRDVATLSISQLGWLIDNVAAPRVSIQDFQVTWSGFITAPVTGEYVFGISPTDPNHRSTVEWRWGRIHSQIASTRVVVSGNAIVDAAEGRWQRESAPTTLQAGAATPLEVTYTYKSDGYVPLARAPVAQLFWSGPSIPRQAVPSSALSQQNGTGGGLDASYRSLLPTGELVNVKLVTPSVDLLAPAGQVLAPEHPEQLQLLGRELVRRALSPAALDQFAATGDSDAKAILFELKRTMELLTSSERSALAEALASRPGMVGRLPVEQTIPLYFMLRHNSPDASLEILASWMKQNWLREVQFSRKYHDVNREILQSLAYSLVREYPSHADRFRDMCLATPSGACSLPAAMVVGYAELMEGRIEDWIVFLDAKLSGNISGDARATWLVARAHAQEIRKCPSDPHVRGVERIFSGLDLLREAQAVAVSDSVRVVVARDVATRIAWNEEFDTARDWLDNVSLTEASGALGTRDRALADLQAYREEIAALHIRRAADAHHARIAHVTKRLRHAQGTGSRRAEHYSRLLAELKSQPQP